MAESTFKQEKKADTEAPKKKFMHLLDEENVEIKRLDQEDIEDCVKVMRKCAFDVTEVEVGNIIKYGKSFGATVNRMIVGVGLAWPAHLDMESKTITSGDANALYLEDPAVLLAYEGRGVRRILLAEREKEAASTGLRFTIGYLYEDIPKENIAHYILEAGSTLEKLYLSEGYEFFRTERGILAFKRQGASRKEKENPGNPE
jgi:GNAT superfamily N-acetyltransferase